MLQEYGRWRSMAADFGNFKPTPAKPHYHLMVRALFSRKTKSSGRWNRMART